MQYHVFGFVSAKMLVPLTKEQNVSARPVNLRVMAARMGIHFESIIQHDPPSTRRLILREIRNEIPGIKS
jgi:hypothetical protein